MIQTINLQELFSIQNIIIYFVVINLIGFFIMWLDKVGEFQKKHYLLLPDWEEELELLQVCILLDIKPKKLDL